MSDRPAPLTPAACDLQDFPFMPLHVARLRDSDLAATAHPEACWYGVLLWSASWHQVPAASLPDDDAVLTRLIGLGRDVKTFRRHKADALRGFELCADGRLYHRVVAEQANTAWEGKLQQRWRTDCARIKKANQRNETDLPTPTFEQFVAGLPTGQRPLRVLGDGGDCPEGQPEMSPGTDTPCPSGNDIQEKGIGKGTGTGRTNVCAAAEPRRSPKTLLPDGWAPNDVDIAYAAKNGLSHAQALRAAERFENHARQTARRCANWSSAWRNWVLKDVGDAEEKARPKPTRKVEVF